MMIFIFTKSIKKKKSLRAHVCDCHFEATQFITGMPQKQLPLSPEGNKERKKESKGEIQISHIEVPPPAKSAVKTERVCPAPSIAFCLGFWDLYLPSDLQAGFALISFFVVKTNLSQVPLCHSCIFSVPRP